MIFFEDLRKYEDESARSYSNPDLNRKLKRYKKLYKSFLNSIGIGQDEYDRRIDILRILLRYEEFKLWFDDNFPK